MLWKGVMPAMTTPFDQDLRVDRDFMTKHAQRLLDSGCTGLVLLGSLGEASTLTLEEKKGILIDICAAIGARAPVVAAISGLSTSECGRLAEIAAQAGCKGLMVLPPYVYRGDWREMREHVATVFRATSLSCMLYNNPISYGTDFSPEQIRELAQVHANLHAVKESSTDVRRVSAIRALLNDRLAIFMGVDDAIVEGVQAGAVGWVAGLVNALPDESVALFDYVKAGRYADAFELYRWFLPLLRLDTVPKFIQLIKLVQKKTGMGSARVRPPRLELVGIELEQVLQLIDDTLRNRPRLAAPTAGTTAVAKRI